MSTKFKSFLSKMLLNISKRDTPTVICKLTQSIRKELFNY